ncbi:MAG: hypothetical protein FGM57_01870 [Candidatus Taylorbacteria bacterium]|nr:hypothetical protein [Candidatus Taylorbacteria bacterium]
MKTFLRVLIIGAILLILVLLSVGIVRIVPKALSSLASATVSINSLFTGNDSTASTTKPAPSGTGFVTVATSTQNATSSILDILKPNFNKYGPNNYVPTPGTNSNTYNRVNGTANGRGVSTNTVTTTCAANGSPDLAVSIIGKGVISKTTGQYVETNNFTTGDMVSIKFKIENRGTCPTGTWNLNTTLPSQNSADRTRNVTNVASLPAGSAVTGQANFDMPQPGNVSVTLVATDGSGKDTDASNNTASQALSVVNTGTTGGTNVTVIGNGQPDLIVRVLQTGILTYNNQFIPTGNTFRASDRVAVKFEVVNQGQTTTGPWNFRAELSDFPNRVYNNNQYEAGIPSAGKAVYTIAFDNVRPGSNTITLFVDSMNQVNEFNESNNTSAVSFNVNY